MNLAEALDNALPELPVRSARERPPQLDPSLIVHEEPDENGNPIFTILARGTNAVYRLGREQWELALRFDGQRTCEQIREDILNEGGGDVAVAELRQFAANLDDCGLLYKAPQERNITFSQKLAEERRKGLKRKHKFGDVARINVLSWDPDEFVTRFHEKVRWIYTGWFTALTLALFAAMTWIFILRFGEIGRDTIQFYNFTQKTFADVVEFWALVFVVSFFHESAHAVTCRHFEGHVHTMGLQIIWTMPCFFVDVIEGWLHTTRWQRLAIIIAGIWVEMILCGFATILWWSS